MMRRALATITMLSLAGIASADPAASAEHFAKAQKAYSAGSFQLAADEFQLAYAEFAAPEYLNNIAQAYRRLGRCADALRYFERFLAAKPTAPNRAKIEEQITALRAQCPAQPAQPAVVPPAPAPVRLVAEPAAPVTPPPAAVPPPAHDAVREDPTAVGVTAHVSAPAIALPWSVDAELGAEKLGAGPVVMPTIARLRAVGRRATGLGALHVGVGVALAALPYDDATMTRTAWLAGPIATVDDAWSIGHHLAIIAEASVGAQVVSGFAAGNPFTTGGRASGAFAMPYAAAAVGVAWHVRDHLQLRVLPLAYEATLRSAPLATDIDGLRGFAMMIGATLEL